MTIGGNNLHYGPSDTLDKMNHKISYILPTNRRVTIASPAIKAVLDLPPHDFEILIAAPEGCIPDEIKDDARFKWVPDKTATGACQPTNEAYKCSDGDLISIMSDDIMYPANFLDVVAWMDSPEVQKKEFKIVNLMWDGGPGLFTYGHDDVLDGTSFWWPPPDRQLPQACYPYSVIPMPFIHRDTVEKHFLGYIYHPDFLQHYGDHWIGFYASKNETYKPNTWRCPTVNYIVLKSIASMNSRHDAEDIATFRRLASQWCQTKTPYV